MSSSNAILGRLAGSVRAAKRHTVPSKIPHARLASSSSLNIRQKLLARRDDALPRPDSPVAVKATNSRRSLHTSALRVRTRHNSHALPFIASHQPLPSSIRSDLQQYLSHSNRQPGSHRLPAVWTALALRSAFSTSARLAVTSPGEQKLPIPPRPIESEQDASEAETAAHDPRDDDKSLTGRLKTLMRKYGWAAVAVYIFFSFVDFGLVFFAINLIGAEYVQRGEDYVLDTLIYGRQIHGPPTDDLEEEKRRHEGNGVLGFLRDWREKKKQSHLEQAHEAKRGGNGGLWAMAVLAYGIHKTALLPFRLGATAAATPAIVR